MNEKEEVDPVLHIVEEIREVVNKNQNLLFIRNAICFVSYNEKIEVQKNLDLVVQGGFFL